MNVRAIPQWKNEQNSVSSFTIIKELISPQLHYNQQSFISNKNQAKPKLSHSFTPKKNSNCSILDYDFVKKGDCNQTINQYDTKAKTKPNNKVVKSKMNLKRSLTVNKVRFPNDSLYEKQMEAQIKLNDKLNTMRIEKQMKELSLLKPKPEIDSNSIKLLNHSSSNISYKPIHKRVDAIIKNRQSNVDFIKSTIEIESKKNKSPLYQSPHKTNDSKQHKSNFIKWIEVNEIWEQTRKEKLTYMKKDMQKREVKEEELYFHPKIDSKSSLIAQYKIKLQSPLMTVEDRLNLTLDPKNKRIISKREELTPSFSPSFNYKMRNCYYFYIEENQKDVYNWKNK